MCRIERRYYTFTLFKMIVSFSNLWYLQGSELGPTKQVVFRNRSICLIVGDVVCLCAVTATVLEIKVINYENGRCL